MPAGVGPVVAVLGSINLDFTVEVDELPRPGQAVLGGQSVRGLGGKGANQATAAAQLIDRCRMLGAVGNDPDGDWLLAELDGFGVDISAVHRDEAHGSGIDSMDDRDVEGIAGSLGFPTTPSGSRPG